MRTYKNPILAGFYPDPSICRVGEDYYLVNSTFAYFPGVPIFHSKNLVDWEQIGHVLTRRSQVELEGCTISGGIYAPTLRYHKGKFYVITTNVRQCGNFYVTAERPEGPWSEPIILPAEGIDPTIFFEGEKAYYLGTREKTPDISQYYGDNEIWLQELDLDKGELIGEKHVLWEGAMRGVEWPEGPHLYKIGDYYYLMIAEGGTGLNHSITVARSKKLFGPYEGNPRNPIITHRHLGKYYPIINVGHGDLVNTQNGEWWMVLLASRPCEGYCNLGRETFLVPVTWEDEWPVVNIGRGIIEEEMKVPDLPMGERKLESTCDHFTGKILGKQWMFLRNPSEETYSLERKEGYLSLKLRPETIFGTESPSFIARRQQHITFRVSTSLIFTPENEFEEAGVVLIQNEKFNLRYVRCLKEGKQTLCVIQCVRGEESILASCEVETAQIYLTVIEHGQKLEFLYGKDENCTDRLINQVDASFLSTEKAGGFVGTCIGMYASSNGKYSTQYAEFEWFEYLGQS